MLKFSTNEVDACDSRARPAFDPSPARRHPAGAGDVAIPQPPLVSAVSFSAAAVAHVPALAHAHGLRRRRRRTAGRRPGPIRALVDAGMVSANSITLLVKAQAYGLGFDLVGVATLGPAETAAA